jgi:hypothetical protein
MRADAAEVGTEGPDEHLARFQHVFLVSCPVRLEPGLLVVSLQISEELEECRCERGRLSHSVSSP